MAVIRCWRLFCPFCNNAEQFLFPQIHNPRLHHFVQVVGKTEPFWANKRLHAMCQISRNGLTYSAYYRRKKLCSFNFRNLLGLARKLVASKPNEAVNVMSVWTWKWFFLYYSERTRTQLGWPIAKPVWENHTGEYETPQSERQVSSTVFHNVMSSFWPSARFTNRIDSLRYARKFFFPVPWFNHLSCVNFIAKW